MTTRIHSRPDGPVTRGILYVHSAPSALCPRHRVGGGRSPRRGCRLPDWTPQPAQPGSYRAELSWCGPAGTAAAVASALRGWNHLRFEITEEPTTHRGHPVLVHPDLGVFHAVTGRTATSSSPRTVSRRPSSRQRWATPRCCSRSTSCSASRGTTSSRRSATPGTVPRCVGSTRWSRRGVRRRSGVRRRDRDGLGPRPWTPGHRRGHPGPLRGEPSAAVARRGDGVRPPVSSSVGSSGTGR